MEKPQGGSSFQDKMNIIKNELVTDKIVDSWFLMGSPLPVMTIVGVYLLFVLRIGPKFMKNRKPFHLKGLLLAHNFFQVFQNVRVCYMLFSYPGGIAYWLNNLCTPPSRVNNPYYAHIVNISWYFFLSKVLDLWDTVFFVLRKKQSQVTFLHVVHHSNLVVVGWVYTKYMRAEEGALVGSLNAFVHIIMYSYYFLSALGPPVQKYLWWKRYITELQITHFIMIIIFVWTLQWNECTTSLAFSVYASLNSFIYLILFLNFYFETYESQNKGAIEEKDK